MELADGLARFIQTYGVMGVMVLFGIAFIVGGFKKIWVWGWYAAQCEAKALVWEERYFKQIEKTDAAVQATKDLAQAQAALQSALAQRHNN